MIEVVINIDNNYAKYAVVTLISILENTKAKVSLTILTFDKKIEQKEFNLLKKKYKHFKKVKVKIVNLDTKIIKHSKHKFLQHISISAYGRLFIPKLLKHLEKIIYIDTDLIFNGDIAELWETDVSKIGLAGVVESKYVHLQSFFVRDNYIYMESMDKKKYINSGLLIMNPELLDKQKFTENCLSFIKDNPKIYFGDQDIINSIKEDVLVINPTWNSTMGRFILHRYNWIKKHNVVHYVTAAKPWKDEFYYKFVNYLLLGRKRTNYWNKYYKIYNEITKKNK